MGLINRNVQNLFTTLTLSAQLSSARLCYFPTGLTIVFEKHCRPCYSAFFPVAFDYCTCISALAGDRNEHKVNVLTMSIYCFFWLTYASCLKTSSNVPVLVLYLVRLLRPTERAVSAKMRLHHPIPMYTNTLVDVDSPITGILSQFLTTFLGLDAELNRISAIRP